jgi:hypothetical protein
VLDPTTGSRYRTAPDGVIDMRDFRRFRDARTQICLELGLQTCSDLREALLDGPVDHPKKDLNFDRCFTAQDPDCPPEGYLPRFDFNGDGIVSTEGRRVVPLRSDGSPADEPSEATSMTDLEVMMALFDPDPAKTEGYTRDDLPRLMNSVDLQLFADQLFEQGAADVTVAFRNQGTGQLLPERRIPAGGHILYTVPADQTLEMLAFAQIAGETVPADPQVFRSTQAGLDTSLGLCRRRLVVRASPTVIDGNGTASSALTVEVDGCDKDRITSSEVAFTQTPAGPGHGATLFSSVGLDSNGRASNRFVAGTEIASYEITAKATIDLGGGQTHELEGRVTVRTQTPTKIFYRWQQEVLSHQESGSSRWLTSTPSVEGDCDGRVVETWRNDPAILEPRFYAVEYRDGVRVSPLLPEGSIFVSREGWTKCVDEFGMEVPAPGEPPPVLERQGRLSRIADGVAVDEDVTRSLVTGRFDWLTRPSTGPPAGAAIDQLAGTWRTEVDPDERSRYRAHAMPPSVRIQSEGDALRLDGFGAVGGLVYEYESAWTLSGFVSGGTPIVNDVASAVGTGGIRDGLEAFAAATMAPDLLLVPRADASAMRFSGSPGDPLRFERDPATGAYRRYSYCQLLERQATREQVYYSSFDLALDGPYAKGLWKRNTTFVPDSGSILDPTFPSHAHEYPLPAGPLTSRTRHAFVAVPYRSEAELQALLASGELDVPTCESAGELAAAIAVDPNPGDEGSVVRFDDASASPGNSVVSWQWDFGDGAVSSEPSPTHRYRDDGEYAVSLTVRDATGAMAAASVPVVIENRPPLAELDDVVATVGAAAQLVARVGDAGEEDQVFLRLRLESASPGFAPIEQHVPAGIHPFLVAGLPAGRHPVTLRVTDKDGRVATDAAEILVLAAGELPPPPPPPPPPAPTCDPTVQLDGEEQALLAALNAVRAGAGAGPVQASPLGGAARARHGEWRLPLPHRLGRQRPGRPRRGRGLLLARRRGERALRPGGGEECPLCVDDLERARGERARPGLACGRHRAGRGERLVLGHRLRHRGRLPGRVRRTRR